MDVGITMTRPLSFGRDIGPDEKYREGVWVEAILGRGNQNQSDGLPHYHQVYIPYSSHVFNVEPLDQSEELLDENSMEAEVEESNNQEFTVVAPDYTSLYSERDRLKTFGPWKQSYHATPLDLARNGFFYRGPGDRVTCVFCRKVLHKWEEGDVIEDEHRRISPKCPFVNGERNHLNRPISSDDRLLGEDFRCGTESNSTQCVYPAFQNAQLRKETFINWNDISHLSPDSLSEAGFFYTGKGDYVTCHQCGVSIHQWEAEDEPWSVHACNNPRCDFLLHHNHHKTRNFNRGRVYD